MPKVSVVIPTYNRPDALRRAIDSALGQSMANLEIVVAVERGDQSTLDMLARLEEPRVRYVINPGPRGPGPNRDSGVASSTGEWVAFLDDDDEWLPNKLERQLEAAAGDLRTIVSTQAFVITEHSTRILPLSPYDGALPIDEWLFDRQRWLRARGSFAQTSTLLAPRALFERVKFGTSRHEDWEFLIRAVKQEGYSLKTLMVPLVRYPAGGSYVWEHSLGWVDSVRDLLSPRAYSGFCLTVASRRMPAQSRNRSALRLLRMAFRNGRPTAKQLFAFTIYWLLSPDKRARMQSR